VPRPRERSASWKLHTRGRCTRRPIAAALAEHLRQAGDGMCALVPKVQRLDQGAFEVEASRPFGTRVIVESEA
jgi:hypothetical protein